MYRKRQKERRENEAVGKSFDEGGGEEEQEEREGDGGRKTNFVLMRSGG